MKSTLCFFFCVFIGSSLFSQPTPGLNLHTKDVQPGYFLVNKYRSCYLINNCGDVVYEWNTNQLNPIFHVKLTKSGDLFVMNRDRLQTIDWDGNIVKEFKLLNAGFIFTYEAIELPNGNFLSVGRKEWNNADEPFDVGLDRLRGAPPFYDIVVEVNPSSGEIVWMWEIKDHVFQNRNPADPNYGLLEENIDRLDITPYYELRQEEFFMINGMDYNEELDLIALSLRKSSEVVIIDHSTTWQETKGNQGGYYGKGGRILYRWGNPLRYGLGDLSDQQLHLQHNPNWIEYGPFKGQMIVYDNLNPIGPNPFYSEALIFDIPLEGMEFSREEDQPFGPEKVSWAYSDTTAPDTFFSFFTSGAKVMPNGNVYITEGAYGRLFEVDIDGNKVWQYTIPNESFTFRTEKLPLDFSGLDNKPSYTPRKLENPPSDVPCELTSNTNYSTEKCIEVRNIPGGSFIQNKRGEAIQINLVDIYGRIKTFEIEQNSKLDCSNILQRGFYFIQFTNQKECHISGQKLINF